MNDTYETGIDQDQEDLQYHGWPGDGSGEDDLADYNQLESLDYQEEPYEVDTPLGDEYGGE